MSEQLIIFINENLNSIIRLAVLEKDKIEREKFIRIKITKLIESIDIILKENKNIFYDHQAAGFRCQQKALRHMYLNDDNE